MEDIKKNVCTVQCLYKLIAGDQKCTWLAFYDGYNKWQAIQRLKKRDNEILN